MAEPLPPIPNKLYFTIGEVAKLCGVKPHVLRFWEQEFPSLRPVKRRGNRRYYRKQEIVTVREIRRLLHDEGYTIKGARSRLKANLLASSAPASISTPPTVDPELIRGLCSELESVLQLLDQSSQAGGSKFPASTI